MSADLMAVTNIHTEFHRFLGREDKERLLAQQGVVLWLYGLSGSGKSTIANLAERALSQEGRFTTILDGDNLRSGLNRNLGFSDDDRAENIRRNAEVARLFAEQGIITFVSVITPRRDLRALARGIIGEDFLEVFVKAEYATCAERDPKGLYARAEAGQIEQFTGRDSGFEEPGDEAELVLDTDTHGAEECARILLDHLSGRSGS
ncbi:MAG: adenylyl-sulfate kinase [Verrucomicrobiota bacterium]|jgi:adenylylsulfate kinase|nr:adenylyl-sulfate kinase [Verrucomicrobiota bacterium]HAT20847.1 adenylyl-sulfate kinase [Verrucomicrobiales bacterium]|tara:strand:- start:565 stop:1179 length:615 start_codon:yes stop_codon:yes gene_type:complete